MKKLFAVAVVGSLLAGVSAWAFPVGIAGTPGYYIQPGGEFTVTPLDASGLWITKGYIPGVTSGVNGVPSIQSFCLEVQEGINGPYPLDAELNPNGRAINGGVGPQGDPISLGTAWLYYKFATGGLAAYGYDYTPGPGGTRPASAQALQEAIWYLEDESGAVGNLNALEIAFLNAAEAANGGTLASAKADNNSFWKVGVLNITSADGALRQDQLVLIPDGGSAMVLLGIGLTSLAFISRKLRA